MNWATGLGLICLSFVPIWVGAEWWHARGMRRRARRRRMIERYCRLEWKP